MAAGAEAVLADLRASSDLSPAASQRLRPLLSTVLLRAQSDERLAALVAAGHQPAFAVIFERYQRELRAHARRIVRSDRVDDVVQQAMLGAWSSMRAGAEIRHLRAWLHGITHNASRDLIAKRGYDDTELSQALRDPDRTDSLAEGRLLARRALEAIAELPEGQRQALTLTAIEGHSGASAADAMGISESALRQIVHRARSRVRAAVSAITPLPLVSWAAGAAQESTVSGLSRLGAGAGLAATATKVAALIGVTGATLGAASYLQQHHQHRPPGAAGHFAPGEPAQAKGKAAPATAPLSPSVALATRQTPAAKTAGAHRRANNDGARRSPGDTGQHGPAQEQGNGRQRGTQANSAAGEPPTTAHGYPGQDPQGHGTSGEPSPDADLAHHDAQEPAFGNTNADQSQP